MTKLKQVKIRKQTTCYKLRHENTPGSLWRTASLARRSTFRACTQKPPSMHAWSIYLIIKCTSPRRSPSVFIGALPSLIRIRNSSFKVLAHCCQDALMAALHVTSVVLCGLFNQFSRKLKTQFLRESNTFLNCNNDKNKES